MLIVAFLKMYRVIIAYLYAVTLERIFGDQQVRVRA